MTDTKDKDSLVKLFSEFVEKHFGGSAKEVPIECELTKSLDEEERMALFVVLEPDVVDLHGDTYSEREVEKGCNSYNIHCRKANLYHRVETEDFAIVQSFINPVTFIDDQGRDIKKGTWLAWAHFPNEELWSEVKKGNFTGLSVGCKAMTEDLE